MYNLAIRKFTSPPPPSSEVENFQMKIYYPGPAEPEADMLPSEPTRRAVICRINLYTVYKYSMESILPGGRSVPRHALV